MTSEGFKRRGYTRLMNWYREFPAYLPLLNESARAAMRLKFLADRIRVNRFCHAKEADIDKWFARIRMFFGFSSIRAGTVFLSNLLKIEVPDSHIEHEANLDDYWNLPRVLADERAGLDYILGFRRKEIFFRSTRDIGIYGEVNPMLRLHCKAIRQVFPQASLFHMVRDPRDVIRSIMGKENLGRKDPMEVLIKPPESDPYREAWTQMTRFERVCWQWQFDNRFMRHNVPHCTRFEPMISDYDYFKEQILDFLNIEISRKSWQAYVARPRNATRKYRMPDWTQWPRAQIATLESICGDEMTHYGYTM